VAHGRRPRTAFQRPWPAIPWPGQEEWLTWLKSRSRRRKTYHTIYCYISMDVYPLAGRVWRTRGGTSIDGIYCSRHRERMPKGKPTSSISPKRSKDRPHAADIVKEPPKGVHYQPSRPLKKANSLKGEDAKQPIFGTLSESQESGAARKHGKTAITAQGHRPRAAESPLSTSRTSDPARAQAGHAPHRHP
jgi:hypothetical protein